MCIRDRKKVKKVVRKEAIERRKIRKLKEDDTRARCEERLALMHRTGRDAKGI